jgi:hypothetical protein
LRIPPPGHSLDGENSGAGSGAALVAGTGHPLDGDEVREEKNKVREEKKHASCFALSVAA